MSELKIEVQTRELTRNKVKQLRRDGLVPIVIYGQAQSPINAQVDSISFGRLLQAGGGTQLVEVNLDGDKTHNVLIREVQRHPVRREPIHADFYAVNMRQKQQVSIPVISVGEVPPEVSGMVLIQALTEVEIEALPADIPPHVEVDISSLNSPDADPITIASLPAIAGVTYLDDPDETVFSLVASRTEVEAEEEDVEIDEDMEPEVIGRDDDEDEEDDD